MKCIIAALLIAALLLPSTALAGLGSEKAAYQGGTEKEQYFPGIKKPVEGTLNLDNILEMRFQYRMKVDKEKQDMTFTIPYDRFIDIEYGQKAGRRVGASIATAILVSPVGLFMLFSKKRKHFVTIGYMDTDGKEQVAVFELGKDLVRTTLPILEARSGKKLTYQDEEAKKSGLGD